MFILMHHFQNLLDLRKKSGFRNTVHTKHSPENEQYQINTSSTDIKYFCKCEIYQCHSANSGYHSNAL
jgi:hypothetical protein